MKVEFKMLSGLALQVFWDHCSIGAIKLDETPPLSEKRIFELHYHLASNSYYNQINRVRHVCGQYYNNTTHNYRYDIVYTQGLQLYLLPPQ